MGRRTHGRTLLASGSPAAITVGSLAELLAFITVFSVLGAYRAELYAPRVRCTGAALGHNLGGILGARSPRSRRPGRPRTVARRGRWPCAPRRWHC
ncbi:hypothetical protein [Streptomyces sp. NPDC001070]